MEAVSCLHAQGGARATRAILFDKFHVLRHLGAVLDTVRKTEYARLTGKSRRFIKGQTYTLLSHWENLTTDGRRSLKLLLKATKRLSTAYLLKEEFGQLWDYEREGWARRFFENWRTSLKWQRLKPYETFAEMIVRHWDGFAAYCKPENKIALGFVEGMNTKIRVIQWRRYAYAMRSTCASKPHLHARPDMKSRRNDPLGKEMTQCFFIFKWYNPKEYVIGV